MSQQNDDPARRSLAGRAAGDVLDGTVVGSVPFGSFVEVPEGVHGLVHGPETDGPLAPGTRVRVEVLDVAGSRMSFRPV